MRIFILSLFILALSLILSYLLSISITVTFMLPGMDAQSPKSYLLNLDFTRFFLPYISSSFSHNADPIPAERNKHMPSHMPKSRPVLNSIPNATPTPLSTTTSTSTELEPKSSLDKKSTLLEVDDYSIAPKPLMLDQVHVYVRHGERTPVGISLHDSANQTEIPDVWPLCTTKQKVWMKPWSLSPSGIPSSTSTSTPMGITDDQNNPAAQGSDSKGIPELMYMRKAMETFEGKILEGGCFKGHLTDLGRQSSYNFGVGLRKLYVDQLGFLSVNPAREENVYFRSSNVDRTIEAAQHVIQGLYEQTPPFIPTVRIRAANDDNLFGNPNACKRLMHLHNVYQNAAEKKFNPQLAALDFKIGKYLGKPIRLGSKIDPSIFRVSDVFDLMEAARAHGYKVPPVLEEQETRALLEESLISHWFDGVKDIEYRKLCMGPLLAELREKMERKVELGDRDPLKLLVYSTHDTALAATVASLGVFDNRWPHFTASLIFEVFRAPLAQPKDLDPDASPSASLNGSTSSIYYVRLRYKNKSLPLPMCAESHQHLPGRPEFCTFEAFKEGLSKMTPADWRTECLVRDPSETVSEGSWGTLSTHEEPDFTPRP
ncbi:hypothetical protein M422DRAFT_230848 [Sphaerobolus stellatus SS14]|uniref:Acid phosphatase n=1 Tax=Sphaerobolus stellatus (strain SS14) TaxID=990650 RepID=A0A0C9UVW1_SPHS4|nr:hypothetical protein M422DRAFT_230848 [Sphaerobolus stellatus SS14]